MNNAATKNSLKKFLWLLSNLPKEKSDSMQGPFTKEQLDLLYGNAEDLVFFMRKLGKGYVYEYVNALCTSTFKQELAGRTVDDSMPASVAEEIKKQYMIAESMTGTYRYRDYNLFSKNNVANETEITTFMHEGELFLLAVSKNVSKQKTIEEDYLFYQSLVQNSVDPMIMISSDFMVIDMNPAYENIFTVIKQQWIGKSFMELPSNSEKFLDKVHSELGEEKFEKGSSSFITSAKMKDGPDGKFSVSFSPVKIGEDIRAYQIVYRELTDEVQLKEELKKTENILDSYKDALNYAAMVTIWEPSGMIIFANDNFEGTTGYEKEELLGMQIAAIGRAVIPDAFYDNIRDIIFKGDIWRGEMKSLKKNGDFFWVDTTVIPLKNETGKIYQVLAIMFDITDRKKLEEKLHFMAYHDSLTRLPNRRLMMEEFELLESDADQDDRLIALLYIDGDDFKSVNDNFGHNIGDEFIACFGQALTQSIRSGDMAARIGGDEFVIAAAGINSEKAGMQIKNLINRIHQKLAEGWDIDGHHFAPTASIGIAFYPKDADNFEDLVKMADSALYESKKSGRNQVRFYEKNSEHTH
ncbi:diguanylate cyclase domain-containing protein [Planomicrobium okeanokoites]|uniref:diguanylate cyclase domain-containing protein n=2 Tax=Caryophanaceae TaxID=186818 RepID=UPI00248F58AB|nr:diguanylate cyclase [Planomicrobium okeanokoites]